MEWELTFSCPAGLSAVPKAGERIGLANPSSAAAETALSPGEAATGKLTSHRRVVYLCRAQVNRAVRLCLNKTLQIKTAAANLNASQSSSWIKTPDVTSSSNFGMSQCWTALLRNTLQALWSPCAEKAAGMSWGRTSPREVKPPPLWGICQCQCMDSCVPVTKGTDKWGVCTAQGTEVFCKRQNLQLFRFVSRCSQGLVPAGERQLWQIWQLWQCVLHTETTVSQSVSRSTPKNAGTDFPSQESKQCQWGCPCAWNVCRNSTAGDTMSWEPFPCVGHALVPSNTESPKQNFFAASKGVLFYLNAI